MRTTEPERWQALLDSVAAIPQATLDQYYAQERFEFLGRMVEFGNAESRKRFSTVEGLNQQLDEFDLRAGIVYYLDAEQHSLAKTAFMKTYAEQYPGSIPEGN